MRYLSRSIFGKIAVLIASMLLSASTDALAQNRPAKNDINFLYAFGAQVGPTGSGKVIPVQNEATLQAGDRLKLFFEPKSDLHFYMLHVSSQGELTPLFPMQAKSARVARGTRVFIPAGDQWFELDAHSGQEKFFLIAAADRLERLEELCQRHATLENTAEIQSSTESILDEIKRLRQQYKQLTAPAEKPVRIGGSVRGQKPPPPPVFPDITPLAAEVTAPGFYTRTFSIDHR
jgi:Domain of unknown function (DUF4384)